MNDIATVSRLLEPYLQNDHFYVVDVQVAGRRGGQLKVTVLLDSDTGISIDECAAISRRLGNDLDEQNVFGDAPFILEVSSPGVDFPLSSERQFRRHIGRHLQVIRTDGQLLRGTLEHTDADGITLTIEPEKKSKTQQKKDAQAGLVPLSGSITIPFPAINKATVTVSFQ